MSGANEDTSHIFSLIQIVIYIDSESIRLRGVMGACQVNAPAISLPLLKSCGLAMLCVIHGRADFRLVERQLRLSGDMGCHAAYLP